MGGGCSCLNTAKICLVDKTVEGYPDDLCSACLWSSYLASHFSTTVDIFSFH